MCYNTKYYYILCPCNWIRLTTLACVYYIPTRNTHKVSSTKCITSVITVKSSRYETESTTLPNNNLLWTLPYLNRSAVSNFVN